MKTCCLIGHDPLICLLTYHYLQCLVCVMFRQSCLVEKTLKQTKPVKIGGDWLEATKQQITWIKLVMDLLLHNGLPVCLLTCHYLQCLVCSLGSCVLRCNTETRQTKPGEKLVDTIGSNETTYDLKINCVRTFCLTTISMKVMVICKFAFTEKQNKRNKIIVKFRT